MTDATAGGTRDWPGPEPVVGTGSSCSSSMRCSRGATRPVGGAIKSENLRGPNDESLAAPTPIRVLGWNCSRSSIAFARRAWTQLSRVRSHYGRVWLAGLCAGVAMGLCPCALAGAQAGPADSIRIERLAALGRLWVSLQYFHPYLAYRRIDWDAALGAAVPKLSVGADRAAWAGAVQGMLDVLGDSTTRLKPVPPQEAPPPSASGGEPDPTSRWARDSMLVVSLRNYQDLADFDRAIFRLKAIADTIRSSRRVVIDLRAVAGTEDAIDIDWLLGQSGIYQLFTASALRAPDQRGRLHSGFPPEDGTTSGGYYSGFYTVDGATIPPGDSSAGARSAVFLVNDRSQIPGAALALRQAGKARIVAEGRASDAGVVNTYTWVLPDSLEVTMRLTELLRAGRPSADLADSVLPPSADSTGDASLDAALALLARPGFAVPTSPPTWRGAAPLAERSSADSPYPALPYRLIAAFRIWAVGQYFFPYRELMKESWDRVLTGALPRLEAARDSLEYALAVAEMATHLHDSHVRVTSPALRARFGTASAPVFVRIIEGVPVISHFTDDSAAHAAGAQVGDIILAVDGENALTRLRHMERYISASTPQALHRNAAIRLLDGPEGSIARVRVRGKANVERTLAFSRQPRKLGAVGMNDSLRPLFRILPGNIGYADLSRLPVDQVDTMFEALKGTRAIIFDMRGYPLGTAWSIAPRMTRADRPVAARFSRPLATSPDTAERTQLSFTQTLPRTTKWRYTRPTVMLIDERTQSQAEHTGLFLEAANGTKFIGTPTAGANGDVTTILLPGGLKMSFSGHEVRHADDRQLQRVGLVPDVTARPTIAGLRAGRDEVLERALRYLARSASARPGHTR